MDGYSFYRCDKKDGRRGSGIVCYVSSYLDIQLLSEFESETVESLWLLFRGQRMPRLVSHVVVGIVYFLPNGDCAVTVTHIIDCLDKIMQRHPNAGIILCGDFNRLNDRAIISYPRKQIVSAATRKNNVLDKIYTNLATYLTSNRIIRSQCFICTCSQCATC